MHRLVIIFPLLASLCACASSTHTGDTTTTSAASNDDAQEHTGTLPAGTQIAIVLTSRKEPVNAAELLAAYERDFSEKATNLVKRDGAKPGIEFDVPRGHVVIFSSETPLPWNLLEQPAKIAWLWPEATDVLRAHQAQLLVAFTPRAAPEPVANARSLTRILASVLTSTTSALGTYWVDSMAVAAPKMVMVAATSESLAPSLFVWLAFIPIKLDDGRGALRTHGLPRFGHKELMLVSKATNAFDPLMMLGDVTLDVLTNGTVLEDGDTFGTAKGERWPVRHVPDPLNEAPTVIQLEMN